LVSKICTTNRDTTVAITRETQGALCSSEEGVLGYKEPHPANLAMLAYVHVLASCPRERFPFDGYISLR
jgi:hypothetical protein